MDAVKSRKQPESNLAYAREMTWFLAPYINSYKRFQAGTFAPTKAIWSLDNRTAGYRVVGNYVSTPRTDDGCQSGTLQCGGIGTCGNNIAILGNELTAIQTTNKLTGSKQCLQLPGEIIKAAESLDHTSSLR